MFRRGKAGVDAAFHEIKAFMQNKGLEADSPVINEGDWIGLEDGHEVAAYGSGEREFSAVYTAFTPPDPPPFDGYQGNTLRLIVVGINSFRSKGPYGAHVTAAIKKALEYATSRWTAVASLPTASP
jgi:hypothetical protein